MIAWFTQKGNLLDGESCTVNTDMQTIYNTKLA